MSVCLVDADLLDGTSTHPNLALMKLSAYHKEEGDGVRLATSWDDTDADTVFVSKVFTWTHAPVGIDDDSRFRLGGTGFFDVEDVQLPDEVEHIMPDYSLYDSFVSGLGPGKRDRRVARNFTDFSLGFLTRGCFRKCPFCVNRRYDRAFEASPLREFLRDERPFIRLWDDNFLAFGECERLLEQLNATSKPFVFQQGLDVRLLTEKRVQTLLSSNYWAHDYIFAFDDVADRENIVRGLSLWSSRAPFTRKHYYAKVYVFCAYPEADLADVLTVFERIAILSGMGFLPYIMRHEQWKVSPEKDYYVSLAAWCNMPHRFLKYSYRDFVERFGERSLGRNVAGRLMSRLAAGDIPEQWISRRGHKDG